MRAKNPTEYDRFIRAVLTDLGLDSVKITWRATLRKNWAGSADLSTGEVYILKYMSEKETLRVLAHELRHIWQYSTGAYDGIDTWQGTKYTRLKIKRGNVPDEYDNQPWEADAEKYAKEARDKFAHTLDLKDAVTPIYFSNGKINYAATARKALKENKSPFCRGCDIKKMKTAVNQQKAYV